MEEDEKTQEEMDPQRPLSRAYLSICPFNKETNKNVEEQKQS